MTKKTLTVGIPVYNEEANISKLVRNVLSQKTNNFEIEKIIVSSDGSTDQTVEAVESINDSRINVINNKDRRGIARGLNQIIEASTSDILVTLDGDVKIPDRNFIKKLIMPIIDENADLTSSSIKEVLPETYISKLLNTSMKLKEVLFKVYKNGNNIYNCHGLARGYSKKFYSGLSFPISVGNDMYSYLRIMKGGLKFVYTPEAEAHYKLPENFGDHKKQSERFFVTEEQMAKLFGRKMVKDEIQIPFKIYIFATLKAIPLLLKNPIDSLVYFAIQLYLRLKTKDENARAQTWDMVVSSKKIK